MAHRLPDGVRLSKRDDPAYALSAWDVYDRETGEHLGYVWSEESIHYTLRSNAYRAVVDGRAWHACTPDGRSAQLHGINDTNRAGAVSDLLSHHRRNGRH